MLYRTDDINNQIDIGNKIIETRPEIYSDETLDSIRGIIGKFYKENDFSPDDLLYISVYDYWLYGFTTEEVFYLNLLGKSETDKQEYISHMDRINYMHHLNKVDDEHLLTNKIETYRILGEYYGREIIYINSKQDLAEFKKFFAKYEEFVIKPVGMATSIGIRKVSRKDYNYNASIAFESILAEIHEVQSKYKWAKGSGVVIEEVIQQGEALKFLHPASINSVRLTTIRYGNDISIFYPVLRIGMGGEFLCCGAVGSILTGINVQSGITETEGRNEWNEHYVTHPNTGIELMGIQVPKWMELKRLAEHLACKFDTIRYIGWDFVFTSDEKWIVMEANENGEFLGQIAYQKGLLKEFQDLINWKSDKKFWWIGKYN